MLLWQLSSIDSDSITKITKIPNHILIKSDYFYMYIINVLNIYVLFISWCPLYPMKWIMEFSIITAPQWSAPMLPFHVTTKISNVCGFFVLFGQRITVRIIADVLNMRIRSVHTILIDHLELRNFYAKFFQSCWSSTKSSEAKSAILTGKTQLKLLDFLNELSVTLVNSFYSQNVKWSWERPLGWCEYNLKHELTS